MLILFFLLSFVFNDIINFSGYNFETITKYDYQSKLVYINDTNLSMNIKKIGDYWYSSEAISVNSFGNGRITLLIPPFNMFDQYAKFSFGKDQFHFEINYYGSYFQLIQDGNIYSKQFNFDTDKETYFTIRIIPGKIYFTICYYDNGKIFFKDSFNGNLSNTNIYFKFELFESEPSDNKSQNFIIRYFGFR